MNTIYYNICSKSLKGSSRELALFTLNISKTQVHVTIEHLQKSERKNKRLDKLKQPNDNLKISSRSTI